MEGGQVTGLERQEYYRNKARQRKVEALVDKFTQYRFTAEHVGLMTNKEWAIAADAAQVAHPSEEVIQMVLGRLLARERASALTEEEVIGKF
jgi:hypothetical protein